MIESHFLQFCLVNHYPLIVCIDHTVVCCRIFDQRKESSFSSTNRVHMRTDIFKMIFSQLFEIFLLLICHLQFFRHRIKRVFTTSCSVVMSVLTHEHEYHKGDIGQQQQYHC